MRSITIITRLTLREAARRKVLWGLLILGLLFLALYLVGMSLITSEIRQSAFQARALQRIGGVNAIYNSFAMMALYAANFLTVMIAVLISIDTLSGEIGSGTIQSIAVKPLRRREIVLGKWLGFAILLGACSLFLIGGVLLITLLVTGYLPPNPLSGLILMFLEALVFLSISLLGGTRLSTLANGVIGFGLFGLAFIGAFILAQMCAVLIWILMPVYANNIYNVPESLYGLIPTTNALMVVFLQVFVTNRTKRYKPASVMMLGTLFYTLGVGSVAFGQAFIGFWISIVIMTIGELILMPTASTYVAAVAPADMRGRYMSIAGLTWPVAAGIAPLLGGYLSDNIAPVATWVGGFIIGLVGILGFYLLSKRQPDVQPSLVSD
jgi:ABC-type transport system involved in multi-copper enzyme maturation permease subunit